MKVKKTTPLMDILADTKLDLTNYELEDRVKQSTFTAMKNDAFQEVQKSIQDLKLKEDETMKVIEQSKRHVKAQDEIRILMENQHLELYKMQNIFAEKLSKDAKLKQIAELRLEKIDMGSELVEAKMELIELREKVIQEVQKRNNLHESWKSTIEGILIEHNGKVRQMEDEIKLLKRQNEGYKASAKQAAEILEDDVSKITSLKSELKLKNDQKQNLIQQKRDFEAKIRALDAELKESKVDECPICFEEASIERKWTAFLPCGHRTCTECADKISALPRNTNRRKCPSCRENINCFLVLEGIYES